MRILSRFELHDALNGTGTVGTSGVPIVLRACHVRSGQNEQPCPLYAVKEPDEGTLEAVLPPRMMSSFSFLLLIATVIHEWSLVRRNPTIRPLHKIS